MTQSGLEIYPHTKSCGDRNSRNMTKRMFQSLNFFVLSCLLLTKGHISPPENVSLRWISDFEPQLSWAPPKQAMENCTYEVNGSTPDDEFLIYTKVEKSPWTEYIVMDGGFLHLSVKTIYNGGQSTPVVIDVNNSELARNVRCSIISSKHTNCSWTPTIYAPDLGFYYELVAEDLTTSINDQSHSCLQACSSYTYTDGVRTGCDMQAKVTDDVHMLLNGTVNNRPVRNTFKGELKKNVRPPPLEWEVQKTGNRFLISWTPPEISNPPYWTYEINCTACDAPQTIDFLEGNKAELRAVHHCPYRMAIKATARGAQMPWSEEKYFNADPDAMVYAAVIIPLMAVSLAALTFVYWMKHKDKLFPKVPKPRDLLSDISDINKATLYNLLNIPAEEESCEITLVVDPFS